ncbi:MAG: hypothetical protein HETSPECPRED_003910 [Heterodermia speciosa]|uniref:Uncharacterized protein n=1 Tax=Heterodermia speciosa TaxID=116794 RepID=A0A8H3FA97_9LECA|nr:MAG: hypothetical protein HETSPECPRED_003910 [Heterodermia speciosa]
MDGSESSHQPEDNDGHFQSPSSSNKSKRQSSFTKPFSGLKRMGSRLVPSSWGKEYEAGDSTTNLLESPPELPGIPSLLNKGNESKESFLTSLNKLADHPRYQSNPAPGLGYKKKEPVTKSGNEPELLMTEPSSKPSGQLPRPVPSTGGSIPRYSNAPILFPSLMAPIRPGDQPPRAPMPRSVTMGNLERRQAAVKEARSIKNTTAAANYMRPTSSSIARRTSAVPSPPSVTPSPKPSAERPLNLKITPRPRLSSSNSSRALRSNATSDLPFRELYGSRAPDENKVQTVARPFLPVDDNTYEAVQRSMIPRATTTTALRNLLQAASTTTSTDEPGRESTAAAPVVAQHSPGLQEFDFNSVKSPQFPVTQNLHPRDGVDNTREAAFYDSPGHTPLNPLGLNPTTFPAAGGPDHSNLRHNALDSPFTTPERVQRKQGQSDIKRGKQRERVGVDGGEPFVTHNRQHNIIGYYDEEGYTAPAKQAESVRSCEGDTIMRGGVGDTETNPGRSIIMRANTVLSAEEEEDDPRNVYTAMPQGFWTGRVSSLNDKFRNEALLSNNSTTHPMMDDTRRMRRVFTELAGFCKTAEAQKSMDEYAFAYWNQQDRQPPVPMVQPTTVPTPAAGGGATQDKEKEGGAKKEKKGMFTKLGWRRKSGM